MVREGHIERAGRIKLPGCSCPCQYQSIQEDKRESAKSITGSHSPVLSDPLPSLLNWQPCPHSVSMPAPPSICGIVEHSNY